MCLTGHVVVGGGFRGAWRAHRPVFCRRSACRVVLRVAVVIEYQSDTVVGGQELMFGQLDTLVGLRRWRDFMVAHQRRMNCRGGCPIGSLGSELAEIDDKARVQIATGFRRWEASIRRGLHA